MSMTRRSVLTVGACFSFARLGVAFQQEGRKRLSPHETISTEIGGDKVTITYGRPYVKGRKIGGEIAPFGQVWRLGADEATKITVPAAMKLGTIALAPGSYSLFAIPGEDKWTIIVNSVADQWGAFDYDKSKDVGRFDLPVKKLSSPVEEFTISLTKEGARSANLSLQWGAYSVSTTLSKT